MCSSKRYQPFKFRTDGNSDCAYKKSFCQEEGMIIYNNGSATLDTQCRCDHTKGYAFVSMTRQNCFCIPSQEDCSCYKKACESKTKLSSGKILIFDFQLRWKSLTSLLFQKSLKLFLFLLNSSI